MSVLERIQRFNQNRDPELVTRKYEKMQEDASAFFRGTCHLFYEDWLTNTALNTAPLTWICGDLHLENFGTYKGDNRLTYFDINDFDESALAPCTWELARFLTSVWVMADRLHLKQDEALGLCQCFLSAYTLALATGQARTVERETATGMIKDLLVELKERDRTTLLDERTQLNKGKRTLIRDKKHPAVPVHKQNKLMDFFEQWRQQQPNPEFFKVLDVTERIAGIGSLGVQRYALLVEGKGSPNQNYLLDFKAQPGSSLTHALTWKQPDWDNPAQRVVAIQQRMQGMPPALLTSIAFDEQFYTLKELQPTPDKLDLKDAKGKLGPFEKVVTTMGKLTAWAQLRSSGRQDSADSGCVTALEELALADDLIAFAQDPHWYQPLLDYAQTYSKTVIQDYKHFCEALEKTKK
jgi:uncharacterized protein (DUF2252 family)